MNTTEPDSISSPNRANTPRRVLCAYSPRWLSGPTPRYRGLCATWEGDEPTTELPAARIN